MRNPVYRLLSTPVCWRTVYLPPIVIIGSRILPPAQPWVSTLSPLQILFSCASLVYLGVFCNSSALLLTMSRSKHAGQRHSSPTCSNAVSHRKQRGTSSLILPFRESCCSPHPPSIRALALATLQLRVPQPAETTLRGRPPRLPFRHLQKKPVYSCPQYLHTRAISHNPFVSAFPSSHKNPPAAATANR